MPHDTMTILTCMSPDAIAAKTWTAIYGGIITKEDYKAKMLFAHESRTVSSLSDVYALLSELQHEPRKFIIRGTPKPNAEDFVFRRSREPGAAFDPAPHHWVMVDVDKQPYPETLDVVQDPDAVIRWVKQQLPSFFHDTQCIYQFSASQNVPECLGDPAPHTVSAHLYFWCDRPVHDWEWKNLFKHHGSKVDLSLFRAVQPHFTANPIFYGMDDPLPKRMGVI